MPSSSKVASKSSTGSLTTGIGSYAFKSLFCLNLCSKENWWTSPIALSVIEAFGIPTLCNWAWSIYLNWWMTWAFWARISFSRRSYSVSTFSGSFSCSGFSLTSVSSWGFILFFWDLKASGFGALSRFIYWADWTLFIFACSFAYFLYLAANSLVLINCSLFFISSLYY